MRCARPDHVCAMHARGLSFVLRTTSGKEAGPGTRSAYDLWLEAGCGGLLIGFG